MNDLKLKEAIDKIIFRLLYRTIKEVDTKKRRSFKEMKETCLRIRGLWQQEGYFENIGFWPRDLNLNADARILFLSRVINSSIKFLIVSCGSKEKVINFIRKNRLNLLYDRLVDNLLNHALSENLCFYADEIYESILASDSFRISKDVKMNITLKGRVESSNFNGFKLC